MPPYIITQSSVTNNQQRTETNSLLMLRKPRKFLRLLNIPRTIITYIMSTNSFLLKRKKSWLRKRKTKVNTEGHTTNSAVSAFSSPEPLGLICNRPVCNPLVSLPRDQETSGSGDENAVSAVWPVPCTCAQPYLPGSGSHGHWGQWSRVWPFSWAIPSDESL